VKWSHWPERAHLQRDISAVDSTLYLDGIGNGLAADQRRCTPMMG